MDIMTKVRVLWEKVAGITADVSAVDAKATATAATLAGILPRIPADYSSTGEVNTGQKWIDGKDIYCKYFSGTFPDMTGATNISLDFYVDSLINSYGVVSTETSEYTINTYFATSRWASIIKSIETGLISFYAASGYSLANYKLVVYYTKPDPTPETREDPEPETRKRKTTKKEDK